MTLKSAHTTKTSDQVSLAAAVTILDAGLFGRDERKVKIIPNPMDNSRLGRTLYTVAVRDIVRSIERAAQDGATCQPDATPLQYQVAKSFGLFSPAAFYHILVDLALRALASKETPIVDSNGLQLNPSFCTRDSSPGSPAVFSLHRVKQLFADRHDAEPSCNDDVDYCGSSVPTPRASVLNPIQAISGPNSVSRYPLPPKLAVDCRNLDRITLCLIRLGRITGQDLLNSTAASRRLQGARPGAR